MNRAQANLVAGDLQAARLDLISVINSDPQNREARLQLVRTYLLLEDGEAAWAQLQDLTGEDAGNAQIAVLKAEAELYRGRPKNALDLLSGEQSADAHRIRSRAHAALSDFELARAELEAGVQADPDDAALLSDYALFLLADGAVDQASEIARKAAGIDPEAAGTRLALGRLALARETPARALEHFEVILAQRPDHAAAVIGKASALGDLGRMDALETFLGEKEGSLGADLRFTILQARLAATKSDWQKVRTLLQNRERELRDQPEGAYIYAVALTELGNAELANTYLMRLESRFPGDPRTRQLRERLRTGTMEPG